MVARSVRYRRVRCRIGVAAALRKVRSRVEYGRRRAAAQCQRPPSSGFIQKIAGVINIIFEWRVAPSGNIHSVGAAPMALKVATIGACQAVPARSLVPPSVPR